jgi:hypothetical protein
LKIGGRACKPDSVRRANKKHLHAAAIIPLGHASRRDSSSLPEGCSLRSLRHRRGRAPACANALIEPGRLSPPIWPCTTRGFPCLRCCHRSGGLLPHLFTLAKRFSFAKTSRRSPCAMPPCCSAGGLFSVALSVTEPHRAELSSTPPAEARNSTLQQSLRGRPLALPGALP